MTKVKNEAVSDDALLGGRLTLRQPRGGHRAGHDALLLAAFVAARPGDRVVDFGAGVGAAGLALAARVGGLDLTLMEIDPDLAALARHNIDVNRPTAAARVVKLDVTGPADAFAAHGIMPDSVDHVLMNPPFNDPVRHRASPDAARRAAHQAGDDTLAAWVHAGRRILKSGGTLSLIWRPEGMAEVLAALARGFGAVTILPVHPHADRAAIRILVRAGKGARGATALMPGIVLMTAAGAPTPRSEAILRDAQGLDAGSGDQPVEVS
ncbi:MAG: methyltransferase [Xanthobacteraceae bacterium]|nr:MAG: methyltransferase [Xanthobacteraceae bacterium]